MYGREGLLLHYTKRGMLGELGELLRNKPMNVNGYPGSYGNALHSAVAYGQRNAIPLLLHHGADINFQLRPTSQYIGASLPEYCRNAVMIAIARQDNEMLKFLILNGANVNIKVPKVDSALKLAILMGNLEITQTLIGHGAVIHDDAKELGDALQAAAFCGQGAIIKYLCDNGANVNARSGVLGSALQAASCMHHLAAVCLLIQRGAKFDFPCGTIFGSALHAAAFAGSVAIVKILLEQGQADVHAYGGIYGSALHAAARQGHVQVVKTLVDAGANVNHDIRLEASMFGTPLQAAALCGADDVVKELLARGADPDGVGYYATKTPLVHAIEQNHPRVVFSLVNGGTVLEPKEKKPRPLLTACESGRPQISSFLISKGAKASREDIVAATKAGHVAVAGVLLDSNPLLTKDSYFLHTAIHMEREDMAKLFIKHGADTNLVNRDLTTLQRAVRHKHVGIVQLLLGHGADPNGPDDSSTPPLVLAVERLDTNIVQILLNAGADPNKREIKYTKATHEDMFRKWSLNLAKPNAFAPNMDTKTLLHDAKQRIEKRKAMKSPMRVAVEKGAPEILDILLKHSGNANESGSYIGARSLLSLAIDKEDAVMVDRLLKAGADVQADTLSLAIAKGQMDVVRCILCAGALLKHDEDFLLPAIEAQNRALVEMLLEHGAKVEPKHQLAAGANNMLSVVNGQVI
jgi:ankyrin repeat protein